MKRLTLEHQEIKDLQNEMELEGTVWRDPETDNTYIIPFLKEVNLKEPAILVLEDLEELELLNDAFLVQGDRYLGKRRKAVKTAIGIARSKVEQRIVWQVYRRDGFKCWYCNSELGALTFDHYLPQSLGGPTNLENGRAACKWCNSKKADRHPDDWMQSKTLQQRKEFITKTKKNDADTKT